MSERPPRLAPPRRRAAPSTALIGAIALAVVGLGCAVTGAWLLPDDLVAPDPSRSTAGGVTVAAAVLVAAMVAARARMGSVGGLRREQARRLVLSLAVLALVPVGLLLWCGIAAAARQHGAAFLGRTPIPLVGAGVAFALADLLLVADALPARWIPVGRPAAVLALLPALVVGSSTALATGGAPSWSVQRTFSGPFTAPAVPASVTHTSWHATFPGRVTGVVSSGDGSVVSAGSTVYGLSGRTGLTRWTYRRPGTEVLDLSATPDTADIAFVTARVVEGRIVTSQLLVLEGFTGRTRLSLDSPRGLDLSRPLLLTDHAIVSGGGTAARPFHARATHGGRSLWSWAAPAGCEVVRSRAVGTGLLVGERCGNRGTVLLLDGRTGTTRWRHGGAAGAASFSLSDDGHTVLLPAAGHARVIDTPDGRQLRTVPGRHFVVGDLTRDPDGTFRDARTGRAVHVGRQAARCALSPYAVAVRDSIVCPAPAARSTDHSLRMLAGPPVGPLTPLTAELGGPFPLPISAPGGIAVTLGAVVVWSGQAPQPGHRSQIVALR